VKIDDSIKKTAGLSNGQAMVQPEKSNNANSISNNSSGIVHLSALSSQLHALEDQLSSNNIFNANKVEEIKLAIANGNFKINSDKVADGLLDTVRDLLHPPAKE
jgi:negative regulator of flagellin synthesis FlgM